MKRTLPPLSPLSRAERARLSRFPGLRGSGSGAKLDLKAKRRAKRDQMRRYRRRRHCTKMLQHFENFEVSTTRAATLASRDSCPLRSTDSTPQNPEKVPNSRFPKKRGGQNSDSVTTVKAKRRFPLLARVPNSFPARPIPLSSFCADDIEE